MVWAVLYRALILLGLAFCLRAPLCLQSSWHSAIYTLKLICLHTSLYLLVSWAWWDWPLTWLTNHCPSVLWHCWLGHVTRKIVSKMTYNVLSATLNPTMHVNSAQATIWHWTWFINALVSCRLCEYSGRLIYLCVATYPFFVSFKLLVCVDSNSSSCMRLSVQGGQKMKPFFWLLTSLKW